MAAATKIAEQLASFNHDTLLLTKQTLRRAADLPVGKAIELGLDMGFTAKMYQWNKRAWVFLNPQSMNNKKLANT